MTVFIRAIDVPVEEKSQKLLSAIASVREWAPQGERMVFSVRPEAFSVVPGSPFAYWVSDALRAAYERLPSLASTGANARLGASTKNDGRFLRLWWETSGARWVLFAKGGAFSRYYADVYLQVNWGGNAREIEAELLVKYPYLGKNADFVLHRELPYLRCGLTWPLRTTSGLSVRTMPAGCIFSHKGPAVISEEQTSDALLCLLAIANSQPFAALLSIQLAAADAAARSYEVGLVQRAPIPDIDSASGERLAALAGRAWFLKRALDTTNETSHAFVLPAGLTERVTSLDRSEVERELEGIQKQIDDTAFKLYGISAEDRVAIEMSSKRSAPSATAEEEAADDEAGDANEDEEAPVNCGPDALGSWLVGVAFGRFDPRLATGERAVPPEPEPFDPLPARSPGMYPEGEEPAERPDILVDDEAHADDLAARAHAVAERVKVEVPENLRGWLAKEFFPLHIKTYSKSRRKAPIYWQLATPSAGYSVWLYIHALSKDTLFRVQNDYVGGERGKLAHEERRLQSLTKELGGGATAAQRKALAAQEALVEELRAFFVEVKRVAPLWNPNLDDGVIINFAPLWRLVPQSKSWQKELKSTWDALCDGKYDWAHLAMHLWPERVVPKCAKDRSLAIAHGLEDVFWVECADGRWSARKTATESVDELVKERTSLAVKSALKSLLEAPVASGKSSGRKGGGRRKAAATADGGDA